MGEQDLGDGRVEEGLPEGDEARLAEGSECLAPRQACAAFRRGEASPGGYRAVNRSFQINDVSLNRALVLISILSKLSFLRFLMLMALETTDASSSRVFPVGACAMILTEDPEAPWR